MEFRSVVQDGRAERSAEPGEPPQAEHQAAPARIGDLETALAMERRLRLQAESDRDAARGALRRGLGLARRALGNPWLVWSLWRRAALGAVERSYPRWSAYFDRPGRAALARMAAAGPSRPVHILVRFDAASAALARRTFAALKALVGVDWSAAVVLDRSCTPDDARRIRKAAGRSPRFDVAPARPRARPDAPALFVQGGALLRPHGAWAFVEALARAGGALAYADEDWLDSSGTPSRPWFKPRLARLLIEQDAILGRVVALQSDPDVLAALADPQADVAAVLRGHALGLDDRRIVHVPHVLFHNALPPPDPRPLSAPPLPADLPRVSVIIPTRDLWSLLGPCLDSVLASAWPRDRLEVIVVDNGSTDPDTLEGLALAERAGRIRVLPDPAPFNFARLINAGARAASGEVLVLLNNDMAVLDPDWIAKLAGWALRPDVGVVGAKLLYPDRTVQHGGVVCGLLGAAGHPFVGLPAADGGYCNLARLSRDILAVTGACIAVRRSTFEAVGGLREAFRVSFNDVAFCIDVHRRGLRNIMLADPLLIHYESKSRGADDTPEKMAVAHSEARLCWAHSAPLLRDDPSYSPNLSLHYPYQRASAPRRRALWTPARTASLTVAVMSESFSRSQPRAAAIEQQVMALRAAGRRVVLVGPIGPRDLKLPGCERLQAYDPRTAAMLAVGREVDLAITHTSRFYPVVRWIGAYAPVIACDYGELAGDPALSSVALAEKALCLSMSHGLLALTPADPGLPALLAEVDRLCPPLPAADGRQS